MKKTPFSKKTVAALLALTVISTAALQPKRSEAAMLLAPFSPAVASAVFDGVLATTITAAVVNLTSEDDNVRYKAIGIVYYVGLFGVLLDDSGQQKVALKPIDAKLAAQAGVTAEEQESYNHELDVIQATFDDISAQVAPLKASERKEASRKLWNEYRSAISPAAFSAFEKIIAQSLR
jgi:hypothetical protein